MPIYEYECETCGERFDKFQHFEDEPVSVCPHGHDKVHRVVTAPTIIFNAPGFYVTDNRPDKGHKREASPAAKTVGKCTVCS
jgi:putative FmdB family regulatory protein